MKINDRAREVMLRRQQLVAQCHLQRARLAAQLEPVGQALTSVQAGLQVAGRLRQHPEWLALAALGVVMLTPRRISAALRGTAQALRTWRTLAPQLQAFLQRR
ncbi:MAG TPA: YqjK family protein [Noviherbaspirillum sp.]|jgi:hypothetical protein|uniref:YqjK family protein n=1 Tax=Noviherbaspirillum sp. TaxID=1926288 RepID=UPI002F925ACE